MSDSNANNTRRGDTSRAARQRAQARASRATNRDEAADMLERRSRARRDLRQVHPDERTAMSRAASQPGAPSITERPDLHTTHRTERSTVSAARPRGSARPSESGSFRPVRAGETGSFRPIQGADDYSEVNDERYATGEFEAVTPRRSTRQRTGTPYVRRERPRHTQAAIDDMGEDDLYDDITYTHDSGLTVGRTNLFSRSSRAYRSAQRSVPQLHKSKGFARYLEVPKGRGSLFSMEQQRRRRRSIAIVVAIVAAIALVIWLIVRFMPA